MSYNGSGTFNLYTPGNPVVTGTTISSTWANNTLSDIATGLSTAITKDGQTTPTANLPMGGFKLTGLAAGSANGDSVRYEQSPAGILTTTGDFIYASAANTASRLPAKADVAAHATTSNLWGAREVVLTGSAVTFTDIADAPYVGAVVWVYQNAAHTWTNGATFTIAGGANYTASVGDWIRIYATTVSTFQITIFPVSGSVQAASSAEQEAGTETGKYVAPATQQSHQSACKGWIDFNGTGTAAARAAYNATLTDNGTGDYTVTWTVPFSSADYAVQITSPLQSSSANQAIQVTSKLAGSIRFQTFENGSATDKTYVWVCAFGDQ